jgi:hypothetical protein
MKKSSLIYPLVFLTFALFFLSCSKDEVIPLTTYTVPQATIKGKVFAELNTSTDFPGYEYAPTGTKIILQISAEQFGISTEGLPQNSYKSYEASVTSSGDYTFTFDATTYGIEVWLYSNQFEYMQNRGKDSQGQPILVRTIYATTPTRLTGIIGGQTVFKDIVYAVRTK